MVDICERKKIIWKILDLKISVNGGKLLILFDLSYISSSRNLLHFYLFSCDFTVSRPDGSQYDSSKTLTLSRKAVQRICPKLDKRSKFQFYSWDLVSINEILSWRLCVWCLGLLEILVFMFPELWWRNQDQGQTVWQSSPGPWWGRLWGGELWGEEM